MAEMTLLIVDSDSETLAQSGQILESNGHRVLKADNVKDGLGLFMEHAPSAILVDLMPYDKDSGVAFVRTIRELDEEVPVYMLLTPGAPLCPMTDYSSLRLRSVLEKPISTQMVNRLFGRANNPELQTADL